MAASSNVEQGKAFVKVLAAVLTRLVTTNDESGVAATAEVTRFHALRPPSISIGDYLERIHKYASCSAECFILALVYIDRLIQGNNLTLTSLNVHRVIITSVMLAAKFFDDQYFNNAYFAKVGGVPCPEMNSLELEFLFSINFSLHVPGDIYNRYRGELSTHMASMLPEPQVAQIRGVMASARAADEPELLAVVPEPVSAATASSSSAASASHGAGTTTPHGTTASSSSAASQHPTATSSSSSASTSGPPGTQGWIAEEDDDDETDSAFETVAAGQIGPPGASSGALSGMFGQA